MALFVTHSPAVGGAEITLKRFLRERPGEHDVLVLSSGACTDYFAEVAASVTTIPVVDGLSGFTRHLSLANAGRAAVRVGGRLPALDRAIRASDQEVVVTCSMKADVLASHAARIHRKAVGIRLHDIVFAGSASGAARLLLRMASRSAASVACVSRAAAEAARRAGLRRVGYFYNGVELGEQRVHIDSGPLRLLTVSQLARWKGIHRVLDALADVRRRGIDATLDVVGDAIFGDEAYRDELRWRGRELGLGNAVRWHGHQADPRPFYRAADVFVHLPEAPDPLPTAVLEAQAWSLPVVAAAVGGVGEIVADGETGLLTDHADGAGAADLIAGLYDPALRARLGAAARERVAREFSVERYVEAYDRWLVSLKQAAISPRPAKPRTMGNLA